MKSVLVLGSGKVGKSVAELLLACGGGNYRVTVADRDAGMLKEAADNLARLKTGVGHAVPFETKLIDMAAPGAARQALGGHDYVICMLPFNVAGGIAEVANEMGVHYFDVTEDVRNTEAVKAIDASGKARVALVPQCGLAPGYIAIAAYDVAKTFDSIQDLTLRVGALPQYPTNRLLYNVTWSTSGLVNEYCEACNVMVGGKMVKMPALEGLEKFSLGGVEYEAFYTSGGVGTLIETLAAQGKTAPEAKIAYKTIRYPGHCELMKFLLQDLRLGADHPKAMRSGRVIDRELAMDMFENAVPRTLQDVVVVFINCIGERSGRLEQASLMRMVPAAQLLGRTWPAIELTTAAGVCAMVDLHRGGKLPATGFVRQEQCTLEMFNATPFGLAYENVGELAKRLK